MASKNRKETQTGRICRLIRGAFNAAAAGNEREARGLIKSAIKEGALLSQETEIGLEIAIRKGLRDTRI